MVSFWVATLAVMTCCEFAMATSSMPSLWRVTVSDVEGVNELQQLDTLSERARLGSSVVFIHTPTDRTTLQRLCARPSSECAPVIEPPSTRGHNTQPFPFAHSGLEDGFYDYFRPWSDIRERMEYIFRTYPTKTRGKIIGQTVEMRDIPVLEFGVVDRDANISSIGFTCGHHAREWIAPAACLYFAEDMLRSNSHWLTRFKFFIVPVVNIDGYIYSMSCGDGPCRHQRKNRSPKGNVDLNRNYGFKWGGPGAMKQVSSERYCGPTAFSEPESRAIRHYYDDLDERGVRFEGGCDVHSFGRLMFMPWGYTSRTRPATFARVVRVVDRMIQRISKDRQVNFRTKDAAIGVGDPGGADDYMLTRSLLGVSFTFELAPTTAPISNDLLSGFRLDRSLLVAASLEAVSGFHGLIEQMDAELVTLGILPVEIITTSSTAPTTATASTITIASTNATATNNSTGTEEVFLEDNETADPAASNALVRPRVIALGVVYMVLAVVVDVLAWRSSNSREPRRVSTAYILWALFGLCGAHRFYCGRVKSGSLYLFTGGLLGIGWIADCVLTLRLVRASWQHTIMAVPNRGQSLKNLGSGGIRRVAESKAELAKRALQNIPRKGRRSYELVEDGAEGSYWDAQDEETSATLARREDQVDAQRISASASDAPEMV